MPRIIDENENEDVCGGGGGGGGIAGPCRRRIQNDLMKSGVACVKKTRWKSVKSGGNSSFSLRVKDAHTSHSHLTDYQKNDYHDALRRRL